LKQPWIPAVVRQLVLVLVAAMVLALLPALLPSLLAAARPVSVLGPALASA
jgi:hypothetical protein